MMSPIRITFALMLLAPFVLLISHAEGAQDSPLVESARDEDSGVDTDGRFSWPFGLRGGIGLMGCNARLQFALFEWRSFYWDVFSISGIFGWAGWGALAGTTVGYPFKLRSDRRSVLRLGLGLSGGVGEARFQDRIGHWFGPVFVPELVFQGHSQSGRIALLVAIEAYFPVLVREQVGEMESEFRSPFFVPPHVALVIGLAFGRGNNTDSSM